MNAKDLPLCQGPDDAPEVRDGDDAELYAAPVRHRIREAAKAVDRKATDAQKQASNAKLGHVYIQGLDITIEVPKGCYRTGISPTGVHWSRRMQDCSYGYIRRFRATDGVTPAISDSDGEHVDVFLGPHPESELVFIIDQVDPKSGRFNEHKCLIGFITSSAARKTYLANYPSGWKGLGKMSMLTMPAFKAWLERGDTGRRIEPQVSLYAAEEVPAAPKAAVPPKIEAVKPVLPALGSKHIHTPEFKNWFGKWDTEPHNASKVVHPQTGEPLRVFHGTDVNFDAFSKDKVKGKFPYSFGFHFTDRPTESDVYATGLDQKRPKEKGGNVVPAYLNARNPLVIDTNQTTASMEADLNRADIIHKLVEAKRAGKPYDSVIIHRKRGDEYDGSNYIVFDPEQVKSAIANRGTFDPNHPNIAYGREEAEQYADVPINTSGIKRKGPFSATDPGAFAGNGPGLQNPGLEKGPPGLKGPSAPQPTALAEKAKPVAPQKPHPNAPDIAAQPQPEPEPQKPPTFQEHLESLGPDRLAEFLAGEHGHDWGSASPGHHAAVYDHLMNMEPRELFAVAQHVSGLLASGQSPHGETARRTLTHAMMYAPEGPIHPVDQENKSRAWVVKAADPQHQAHVDAILTGMPKTPDGAVYLPHGMDLQSLLGEQMPVQVTPLVVHERQRATELRQAGLPQTAEQVRPTRPTQWQPQISGDMVQRRSGPTQLQTQTPEDRVQPRGRRTDVVLPEEQSHEVQEGELKPESTQESAPQLDNAHKLLLQFLNYPLRPEEISEEETGLNRRQINDAMEELFSHGMLEMDPRTRQVGTTGSGRRYMEQNPLEAIREKPTDEAIDVAFAKPSTIDEAMHNLTVRGLSAQEVDGLRNSIKDRLQGEGAWYLDNQLNGLVDRGVPKEEINHLRQLIESRASEGTQENQATPTQPALDHPRRMLLTSLGNKPLQLNDITPEESGVEREETVQAMLDLHRRGLIEMDNDTNEWRPTNAGVQALRDSYGSMSQQSTPQQSATHWTPQHEDDFARLIGRMRQGNAIGDVTIRNFAQQRGLDPSIVRQHAQELARQGSLTELPNGQFTVSQSQTPQPRTRQPRPADNIQLPEPEDQGVQQGDWVDTHGIGGARGVFVGRTPGPNSQTWVAYTPEDFETMRDNFNQRYGTPTQQPASNQQQSADQQSRAMDWIRQNRTNLSNDGLASHLGISSNEASELVQQLIALGHLNRDGEPITPLPTRQSMKEPAKNAPAPAKKVAPHPDEPWQGEHADFVNYWGGEDQRQNDVEIKWQGGSPQSTAHLFGRDLHPHEIAAIANAAGNARVKVQVIHAHGVAGLYVETTGDGIHAGRTIDLENGELVCHNNSFEIDKDTSPHKGSGYTFTARQMAALKRLGVTMVKTYAAGSKRQAETGGYNGFITWPKLRFEGKIDDYEFDKLPPDIQQKMGKSREIFDLMDIPGGPEAWYEHGGSIKLKFSLKDGSRNLKGLERYIIQRQAKDKKRGIDVNNM